MPTKTVTPAQYTTIAVLVKTAREKVEDLRTALNNHATDYQKEAHAYGIAYNALLEATNWSITDMNRVVNDGGDF